MKLIKNLNIISLKIIFLTLIFKKKVKQSICNFIYVILIIVYLEIIIKELFSLINIFKTQILHIYKLI